MGSFWIFSTCLKSHCDLCRARKRRGTSVCTWICTTFTCLVIQSCKDHCWLQFLSFIVKLLPSPRAKLNLFRSKFSGINRCFSIHKGFKFSHSCHYIHVWAGLLHKMQHAAPRFVIMYLINAIQLKSETYQLLLIWSWIHLNEIWAWLPKGHRGP